MDHQIRIVGKRGPRYVASCPELDIYCYGQSEEQARSRMKKVIKFYIETANELGYQIDEHCFMQAFNSTKHSTA